MLGSLAMLGPFAVDTYLPAFGGMQAALHATPLQLQQTLSAYLLAFGFMFLFHGALSDSFGRRPVIVVSLVIFVISSIGAALAVPSSMALVMWREGKWDAVMLTCGIVVMVLAIWKYRSNIQRLIADTENRAGAKKQPAS